MFFWDFNLVAHLSVAKNDASFLKPSFNLLKIIIKLMLYLVNSIVRSVKVFIDSGLWLWDIRPLWSSGDLFPCDKPVKSSYGLFNSFWEQSILCLALGGYERNQSL